MGKAKALSSFTSDAINSRLRTDARTVLPLFASPTSPILNRIKTLTEEGGGVSPSPVAKEGGPATCGVLPTEQQQQQFLLLPTPDMTKRGGRGGGGRRSTRFRAHTHTGVSSRPGREFMGGK